MAGRTVTKRDLAKAVAGQHDVTQAEAKGIVQTVLDQVTEELADGNRLELRDFGVFQPRARKPRRARNPRTGEQVHAGASVTVSFKVGKKMSRDIQKALPDLSRGK